MSVLQRAQNWEPLVSSDWKASSCLLYLRLWHFSCLLQFLHVCAFIFRKIFLSILAQSFSSSCLTSIRVKKKSHVIVFPKAGLWPWKSCYSEFVRGAFKKNNSSRSQDGESRLPVYMVPKPNVVFPLHKNSGCVTFPGLDTVKTASGISHLDIWWGDWTL